MKKIVILTVIFILVSFVSLQAAEKTIGVIMTGDIPYYNSIHKDFLDGLSKEGYGTGKVDVYVQKPASELIAWANAARKFVALDVDLIVTYGAPSTISVIEETSRIPIVFAGVFNPSAVGISAKNITGTSSKVTIAGIIKNFRSISKFSKLGVIYNSSEVDTVDQIKEIRKLEKQFGFTSVGYDVKKTCNIDASGVDALFITTSSVAVKCLDKIIEIASAKKIPTASIIGGVGEKGVIISLYASAEEQGRKAAKMAADVMTGKKPSSIPVDSPSKIEMVISLKEAKRLGFKIPFDLLTSATRVVK